MAPEAPGSPDNTPSEAASSLRSAMSRFPTGVTIVTAPTPEGPAGLAVNAVTSLSLDPPLMLACLDRGSRTLRAVEAAGRFGVNVLSAGTEQMVRAFGSKVAMETKWDGVAWRDLDGLPHLDEAIVFVACTMRDVVNGGDHVIVTGEVEAIREREGEPLLFVNGIYTGL
jgi:3-hydroxy-9,10-secoandrosta-1,3,5(10)-triene-9,17-dione monooxygenase reductase component